MFSIESKSKYSRNSTLGFDSFIRPSMFFISTSVSPAQSVIISRTKSILGFRTAVKSILFDTISSRADAKSINNNGFLSDLANRLNFFFGLATSGLFFLPRCEKFSLTKFKSLIFVGPISFQHGSNSLVELVHDEFVEPVRTPALTRNIAARLTDAHHTSAMTRPNLA